MRALFDVQDVQDEHIRQTATVGVVVRTFWTLGAFRCVLMREHSRLSVQIYIDDRPFLTEPSRDSAEALGQAEALFAVFSGVTTT